jgi:hypothetical protein
MDLACAVDASAANDDAAEGLMQREGEGKGWLLATCASIAGELIGVSRLAPE